MLPYWLFFGFFALGALVSRTDLRRQTSVFLSLAWLVIVLMVGLRWQIGPDWYSYLGWWKRAGFMSLGRLLRLSQSDPLFYSLMWEVRQITDSFWLFNTLMAAAFATGLLAFARTQPNPWLAIAVAVPYLVIVMAMSGVRQATAIGFVFLGIVALQRQQSLKFLVYIAVASAFHASAILVLPLAGLSFARTRFQASILIAVLAVGAFYVLTPTFDVYSMRYLSRTNESSGTLFRVAMNIIPAVLFFLIRRNIPLQQREMLFWRNMSIAALCSLPALFFIASTTALDRLLLYFFPLQIFVFGWLPWLAKKSGGRLVVLTVVIYLGLQLFVFLNFGVNRAAYIPYQTIFSRVEA